MHKERIKRIARKSAARGALAVIRTFESTYNETVGDFEPLFTQYEHDTVIGILQRIADDKSSGKEQYVTKESSNFS